MLSTNAIADASESFGIEVANIVAAIGIIEDLNLKNNKDEAMDLAASEA